MTARRDRVTRPPPQRRRSTISLDRSSAATCQEPSDAPFGARRSLLQLSSLPQSARSKVATMRLTAAAITVAVAVAVAAATATVSRGFVPRHGRGRPFARGDDGGADHEHRRQHRRRPGRRRRHRARRHQLAHVRAAAERRRAAVDRRRRLPQRARSSRSRPSELAEANLADGAEIVELGDVDDRRGRVHLRLLVPGGRRQAEPAPVDRSHAGPALRRDRPRRHVRARSRATPTTTPPTTTAFAGVDRRARRRDARRRSPRSPSASC